ncbi:prealbumin-like fold domain-containing protein [Lysobacter sp. 1R34A]|uniref:prealbumin-like fold domain-containing protein n=1 Tax=Lysobacter sp. 1R34A TaxID=3445786 RepID=UPI003EED1F53
MSAKRLLPLCLLALSAAGIGTAHGQAGIGVQAGASPTGTIGTNKGDVGSGALQCQAGTVVRGGYHRDKSMSAGISSTRGMTNRVGLYCGGITTDGTTVSVVNRNANGTPDVLSGSYAEPGTEVTGYCPANQLVHQFGGWDREWSNGQYPPWSSSLNLVCRPLTLSANSWVRMTTGTSTSVEVGVRETMVGQPAHVVRGPFCNNTATSLVSGLYMQAGGEGYDGINVYCGTLLQARHSAILSFTDFAWNQTRGGSGWLVNLTQGTTLLDNGAGTTGAGRTPHADAAANLATVQTASEIYVLPGSNYRAAISQRPGGIAANTFVSSGTCLTGIALLNEQDSSCTLTVTGLPDIAVTLTTPAPAYSNYGQLQNIVLTATNRGPGATDGDDGFTVVATLPAGWTAGTLPANCTANGANTVVTCALNPTPLAAAAAPGANGGTVGFTIPVTVNSPTLSGSYTANAALGRAVPDGDGDATNNDFNTANDTASGPLVFQKQPILRLRKALPLGRFVDADQFALSIAGSGGPATATTTGSGSTATGEALLNGVVGASYTLSEAGAAGANLANYTTGYACTNALAGGQAPSGSGASFALTAAAGDDLTCSFSNTRAPLANLAISKTNTPGAGPDDQAGDTLTRGASTTYSIVVTNNGPDAVTGAVLRDPAAGRSHLSCTAPPTCSGSACPPTPMTLAALDTGVSLGTLANGASVTVTLNCTIN